MVKARLSIKQLEDEIKAWSKRLKETGVPDCMICKTPMINGYDSITKKISKYIWIYDCKCHRKGIQLMML